MTAQGLHPWCCTSAAETMVVSAMTEPTERSMPPEMMTKVIPMAVTSRKALSMKRLRKTCSEKKESKVTDPAPNITTNSADGDRDGQVARVDARPRVVQGRRRLRRALRVAHVATCSALPRLPMRPRTRSDWRMLTRKTTSAFTTMVTSGGTPMA